MGGNAIKTLGKVIRLSTPEFDELTLNMLSALTSDAHEARALTYYSEKESHGDLDVLVKSSYWAAHTHEDAGNAINACGMVRNGPSTSYAISFGDDNVFQVDLITVHDNAFDFAYNYFSYNDLGNLLGRIAHRLGFKLGHEGLVYKLRDDTISTHVIADIVVTLDWDEAIEFLGYSSDRYHEGFDTLADIFEYVVTSPFFLPEIFLLENRNATSRVRDAKRKTYTEFLKWVENRYIINEPAVLSEKLRVKGLHILRAMDAFPKFKDELELKLDLYMLKKRYQEKINGKDVMALTGLSGRRLGMFMQYLQHRQRPLLLSFNDEEVSSYIQSHYNMWLTI